MLDVEGGCENAKPGSRVILWPKDVPEDNNKFVVNSDGTLQSLCRDDLYLKVERKRLILADLAILVPVKRM
ncbi:hypothetical protein JTB14_008764 [Gonioctena quinquepunctata]|nr:hypothetical protein JTB14_008764 [Gonioctena quinquepunctata]